MSDFDLNAPFDAPIRAREARERAEHERHLKAMKDPKVQRKLCEIVKKAYRAAKRRASENGEPRR
jgi:hypothetical protein